VTLWYLARAAGFAALFAATASVTLGALASGARTLDARTQDRRVLRQLAHRSAAVMTLAMLAVHVTLLVLDSFVDVSLPGVLVPFTAGYRAFAVGLGTLATYGLLVVAFTGAARGRLAASARGARSWRAIHLSAYGTWVLAMGHGLLAGTDTGTWWTWALYGACALTVLGAVWVRVGAIDAHRAAPLPTARRQLTSGGVR
jgi:sulfoxide reductase heme-binding subunit YedZ